jgi:hypothetical protein
MLKVPPALHVVVAEGAGLMAYMPTVVDVMFTVALASQVPMKVNVPERDVVGLFVGLERVSAAGGSVSRVHVFVAEDDATGGCGCCNGLVCKTEKMNVPSLVFLMV